MDLINPNISWNTIKSYITSISGIIFMTPGSRKLIEYLYSGNVKDAAKKINSYIWRGTRDTTMVLITGGLIVLAEKIENDPKTDDDLKQKAKDLTKNNIQKLQTLFERMAEGDGTQLGPLLNGYEEFKEFFKAVLTKSGNNISETKANIEYDKYVAQMRRIKSWKYSANAIQNNVKPVFEKTFKDTLKNKFINNIPIKKEAKYDDILRPAIGHTLNTNDGFTISLQECVDEKPGFWSETVDIYGTTLYVSTDSNEDIPSIRFQKRSLIELIKKSNTRDANGFKIFLKTYFKDHREEIEQAMMRISLKRNLRKLFENYRVEGIFVHEFDIELLATSSGGDYVALISNPFEVKSEPNLLSINVNNDQVLGYLYKKEIVNLADIKTELDRILKPIAEKLNFIKGIESCYNNMYKGKIGFRLPISEPKDGETKTTPNGLEIHYEIANGKINIEVNRKALLEFFAKEEVKDKDAGEREITEAINKILQENPLEAAPSKPAPEPPAKKPAPESPAEEPAPEPPAKEPAPESPAEEPAPESPAEEPAPEAVRKSTEDVVKEALKKFNGDNKDKELYSGKKYTAIFDRLNLFKNNQKDKLLKQINDDPGKTRIQPDGRSDGLTIFSWYNTPPKGTPYIIHFLTSEESLIERLKNKKISNNSQKIEALLKTLLNSTQTPIQQHFASKK